MTLNAADKTRFLEALRDDPEFLQQVRQHVLVADLLELPERFAVFASTATAFMEQQREINTRVDERFDGIDRRLQQITDDIGDLKGHVAGRVAREMADDIAERFGFQMIEVLNGNDLRQMLRQHNPADIDPGVRRSFYLADLVGRVIDRQGNEIFLAAEASYTADQRDSDRAIRNAQFLTRFTGVSAVPAVASRHNDHEVQRLVEAGTIRWFEFDQRDLSPQ